MLLPDEKEYPDELTARYELLEPELPLQFERWNQTQSDYNSEMRAFVTYTQQRPAKLLQYFQSSMNLSQDEMLHYFKDALIACGLYTE